MRLYQTESGRWELDEPRQWDDFGHRVEVSPGVDREFLFMMLFIAGLIAYSIWGGR